MNTSVTTGIGWNFILSFALVIGGLVFFLWLLKRLSGQHILQQPHMHLKAQVVLGPKEKVVLIEIDNEWIVAGVTSQSIQTLHILPKPADSNKNDTGGMPRVSFLEIFNRFRSSQSDKSHP